jgi:hypothetical protein
MRKMAGVSLFCFMIAGVFFWTYESRKIDRDERLLHMAVKPAELADETKRIFSIIGQHAQLFDVDVDPDQASMIKVWVERFEHGEKRENVIDYGVGIDLPDAQEASGKLHREQLLFILSQNQDQRTQERRLSITSAVMSDASAGSTTSDVHLPPHTGSQLTWMNSAELELHLNRPVTLGFLIEFDDRTIRHSGGSAEEYDATGNLPEELRRHDRVFLLRMMLQGKE